MKRNLMATLVMAGSLTSVAFGQQYPYPGDPNYNGQYPNNGGYYNPNYDPNYDPNYNPNAGIYAPVPPPPPAYAYQRPPMPGPGYFWVDGYWNFVGGRYAWIGGYWAYPPYAGGYWVAPRYTGGRFFLGFWGGNSRPYYGVGRYNAPRVITNSRVIVQGRGNGGFNNRGKGNGHGNGRR